jgi:hypothetical protein
MLFNTSIAQTAAPATTTATAPASVAAPAPAAASASGSAAASAAGNPAAGTPSGQGRASRPAGGPQVPPAAWDRPADGPAIFSDDFESGALNDKTWTPHIKGDTAITVQQNNVAHGKYAVQVHCPKGASGAYAMIGMAVPEALRDHFYGRAYVSINGIPAGHCVLMLAGSLGYQLSDFLEIGASKGKFQPSFQLNKPTPDRPRGEKVTSQGNLPVGRWFCLEWEFFDKPDRIVLWVDGKLTANQTLPYQIVKPIRPANPGDPATPGGPIVNSGLTGGFFEFNLGFRAWGGAVANDVDIYYDDVAIGDKPIGQLTPVAEKPKVADAKP